MKPIIMLVRACMDGNMETVFKMIDSLGIVLKTEEREKRGKDLFKNVFQKWLNAADALIEMIIMKLPSPRKARLNSPTIPGLHYAGQPGGQEYQAVCK